MHLLNNHFKESLHDFKQLDAYLDKQSALENAAEARENEIATQVNDSTGEYYFLSGDNLMEAITESGNKFEQALSAAVQKNDAQAVLKLIKDESKTYWTKYLQVIAD
jgi:hypothetical protein